MKPTIQATKLTLEVCVVVYPDASDETKRAALYEALGSWLIDHKILRSVDEESVKEDDYVIYGTENEEEDA
ncbi:MAG: hypothetical protein CL582_22445 [Alteromonadaceae bacterium]|nr:hypothetical protein [Alteromonadaceae bacterium]